MLQCYFDLIFLPIYQPVLVSETAWDERRRREGYVFVMTLDHINITHFYRLSGI